MSDPTQLVDELRRRIAYPTVHLPRELDHAGNPAETEERWAARAIAAGLEDGTLGYVPAGQQLHRADFDHLAAERDRWKNHSTQVQFETDRLTVQLAAIRDLAKLWTRRHGTPEHDCGVDILKTLGRFDGGTASVPGSSRRAQECSQACTEGHQYDETCELGSSRRAQEPAVRLTATKIRAAIRDGLMAYPNSLSEGMDEAAVAVARLLDQAGESALGDVGKCPQCGKQSRSYRRGCSWCGFGRPASEPGGERPCVCGSDLPLTDDCPQHGARTGESQASERPIDLPEQCDECETTGVNCRAHRTAEQQQRAGW